LLLAFQAVLPFRSGGYVIRLNKCFYLPSLGVIDGVALLVEEWGRRSGYSSGGYAIRLHGV
jgi:hypothetical protein